MAEISPGAGPGDPDDRPGGTGAGTAPRLAVLKALGDNTRYAIYLELARSPRPLGVAEIASTLGLHPNTVRPHLERMREVGLLEVEADSRGQVGRPQHLYRLAEEAPSLGLEPPTFPMLARLLVRLAAAAGADPEDAAEVGRDEGRNRARHAPNPTGDAAGCLSALVADHDTLGFDPALGVDDDSVTVAFAHCPFRSLAETHPGIVCHLHRGLVEGFVDTAGGCRLVAFGTLTDREPCTATLVEIS